MENFTFKSDVDSFTFATEDDNPDKQSQKNTSDLLNAVEEIRETAEQAEKNTFEMLTIVEEMRESVTTIKNILVFYLVISLVGVVATLFISILPALL